MVSSPITSWQIDGETMETWQTIFSGSKITMASNWSHEINRCLLLGRKAMTNLYSIFKSRDITWSTSVKTVKAVVFPVVMYGCESWAIKKVECQRIDAFYLWCWRRLLRVPWTAKRSNQSILKEINSEYSLEGQCWSWSSNLLATWYEELTHWKRPWCWERLKTGGEGDDRGWEGWMASPTQWTWVWANSRRWWRTGSLAWCSPWGHRVRHEWVTEEQPPPLRQLHDWTGFNQRPSNSWFCFCPYPTPKSQKDYYAADLYPNSKSLEPFNVSWKWTIIGGMLNLFCFSGSELPDFSCQENWYWRVHSRRAFTNSLDDL